MGWSDGVMVLGKLSVPGKWIVEGQGHSVLAVYVDKGCLAIFISSVFSLFFLPLFGRRPDIDRNTCLKGPLDPKQQH